jgi:menaquinone-9 beta-reductase
MRSEWDVAVVGAGPAGATTAFLLAREGCRVVLLDRQHFPRPKACAEYLSPGVRRVLQDIGLETQVLHGARQVRGMDVIAPSGKVLRLTYSQSGRSEYAASLARDTLDEALVLAAVEAGAHLCEGFVAREALHGGDRVRGVTGMSSGRSLQFRAAVTIVADGNRSTIARSLGVARAPRWPVRMGLVAHAESVRLEGSYGQMHVTQQGYCGIAPMPDGLFNVAMVVPVAALKRSRLGVARFFDAWIARHERLHAVLSQARLVTSVRGVAPIGSRASRVSVRGALLVGDAAGFFDPFTGEGIYRALRGAQLAAEVAKRGLSSPGTFDFSVYDRLRTIEFRKKSAVTTLVQLFVQHPAGLDYAISRLQKRETALSTLANVLGDLEDAGQFWQPRMLWAALRP